MSATQQSDRTDDPSSPGNMSGNVQRFRAPTVEEALRRARELLGDDAEIIEANRIRRGGIGGFFATELGVEVVAQSAEASPAMFAAMTDEQIVRPPMTPSVTPPTATGPVIDLGGAPARGRAAWRAATSSDFRPLGEEQLTMPVIADLVARAAAQDSAVADRATAAPAPEAAPSRPSRPFRPWKLTAPADDVPATDVAETIAGAAAETTAAMPAMPDVADPAPTTFAEHFLRELMHDAEALRTRPDRNRALPPSRRRVDDPALPGLEPMSAPAPAPEPDPAEHTTAAPASAPSTGATRSAPRRRAAPARNRTPRAATAPQPELPLDAAPAAPAAAAQHPVVAAIVDQCMQLAAMPDRTGAPTKVALSMTLADGGVVKVTVEMPRTR